MLVKQAEGEHHAHCANCSRDSRTVQGSADDAKRELEALGWMVQADDGWRCPVCCSRASGEWGRYNR